MRLAEGEAPRLALWTPGPYNETYFEHAYLARYLGLPLVEGGDLIVRDEARRLLAAPTPAFPRLELPATEAA